MGKKPFPKRASGGFRSSRIKFYRTAGIEPKRIGGKKVRKPGPEVDEEGRTEEIPYKETVLYTAPIIEAPVTPSEIKLSFGERLKHGLWGFMHRERG